ncbi:MAG: restriction endonuclease [Alphaproteobacteria bacterium]
MAVKLPTFRDLLFPTLEALRSLGGSASRQEIIQATIEREKFTQEQLDVLLPSGAMSKIVHRIGWVVTGFKLINYASMSDGICILSEKGLSCKDADEINHAWKAYYREYNRIRKNEKHDEDTEEATLSEDELDWRESLIAVLLKLSPAAFERFCQLLLRKNGFSKVEVTGRSGDGGIDGIGIYQMGLMSFNALFQCKRYKGSVSSQTIRDFRGAMVGRTDKGMVITTGTFTSDARKEATRDGAPPVELIDGNDLCDLIIKQTIEGIKVEMRPYITISENDFLKQFEVKEK